MSQAASEPRSFDGIDPSSIARAAVPVAAIVPPSVFATMLATVPDPALALANWQCLVDQEATPDLGASSAEEIGRLLRLLGSSQALANTLLGAGAKWLSLFRECALAPSRRSEDYAEAFGDDLTIDSVELHARLRRLRNHEYLRIGLADLEGRYDVDTTIAELSALADGTCAAAVRWAAAQARQAYGEIWVKPPVRGRGGTADALVVFGMGKLGGRELNFSSDIDLFYLYETDQPASTGGARGQIDARGYFTRMAEMVTKALNEITGEGFVFRVDLRLRPDGVNGPIANSVSSALLYYESYGQTWERTALIQARPIAGAKEVGDRFLQEVRPFIYRRYLDYATVADMKAMKRRVESQIGNEGSRYNVKLGKGGVREIEFLAQVLQLIHGGRDERLRGGGSLRTLSKLVEYGYMPAEEGEVLRAAYRFLRNVEHKIQIVHQRQTHSIPEDRAGQETLARRLGYSGEHAADHLWGDLDRHREIVRRSFERLFYEPEQQRQRAVDSQTEELLRRLDDKALTVARLAELGFAQPDQAHANVLLMRDGPSWAPARARRRQALSDLAPALLSAILKSADPDLALQSMATFLSSIGARTSFLSLLQENPATLRMLADLFGGSQYLANWFIRHPELLDSLVRADLVRLHRDVSDLEQELVDTIKPEADIESQLDALRRFRNHEFLRIGINDLQATLEPPEVSIELTSVAEACLRRAFTLAADDVCRKSKIKRLPGQCIVLAMGKLGSRELNYNSDLDLIFVYEESRRRSSRISAQECFAKLAQRLMMLLQTTTREGIAYRIDTRLRPSGNKGPLVTSFAGFQDYHRNSAQLWERQALIKARPIAGSEELASRVNRVVAQFVYRAPLTAEEVGEIRRLRQRMELEIAHESIEHVNIKTGRGGLIDIEFLTQMLQMHYGARVAELQTRATLDALAVLARADLLPQDDFELLVDGYRFIRRVENILRLAYDRPVEGLDRGQNDLRVVARRMGFDDDEDAFWKSWESRREAIRSCYDRWFEHIGRSAD